MTATNPFIVGGERQLPESRWWYTTPIRACLPMGVRVFKTCFERWIEMRSVALPLVVSAAAIGFFSMSAFAADSVPCEDKLTTVRAELKSATLDAAKKNEADALLEKGIERCNADDDQRANGFFTQIEAILGK
jgi:hypothetical protein